MTEEITDGFTELLNKTKYSKAVVRQMFEGYHDLIIDTSAVYFLANYLRDINYSIKELDRDLLQKSIAYTYEFLDCLTEFSDKVLIFDDLSYEWKNMVGKVNQDIDLLLMDLRRENIDEGSDLCKRIKKYAVKTYDLKCRTNEMITNKPFDACANKLRDMLVAYNKEFQVKDIETGFTKNVDEKIIAYAILNSIINKKETRIFTRDKGLKNLALSALYFFTSKEFIDDSGSEFGTQFCNELAMADVQVWRYNFTNPDAFIPQVQNIQFIQPKQEKQDRKYVFPANLFNERKRLLTYFRKTLDEIGEIVFWKLPFTEDSDPEVKKTIEKKPAIQKPAEKIDLKDFKKEEVVNSIERILDIRFIDTEKLETDSEIKKGLEFYFSLMSICANTVPENNHPIVDRLKKGRIVLEKKYIRNLELEYGKLNKDLGELTKEGNFEEMKKVFSEVETLFEKIKSYKSIVRKGKSIFAEIYQPKPKEKTKIRALAHSPDLTREQIEKAHVEYLERKNIFFAEGESRVISYDILVPMIGYEEKTASCTTKFHNIKKAAAEQGILIDTVFGEGLKMTKSALGFFIPMLKRSKTKITTK